MPPSSQPRVFISYARKDGAVLAQRLQSDLTKQGFDAWLDTQRIEGGATWTTKIEDALDNAEYVLALMTAGRPQPSAGHWSHFLSPPKWQGVCRS